MTVPAGFAIIAPYVVVGAILFGLGLIGFLARRNLIIIFLCTELMFQGVIVNLVAFGRMHGELTGQVFSLFLLVIAAAEAVLALALAVFLYRRRPCLDVDLWNRLRG